jgi:hypothetical protein
MQEQKQTPSLLSDFDFVCGLLKFFICLIAYREKSLKNIEVAEKWAF